MWIRRELQRPILAAGMGLGLMAGLRAGEDTSGFQWIGPRAGTLFFAPSNERGNPLPLGGQAGLVFDDRKYGLSLEAFQYFTENPLLPDVKIRRRGISATFLSGLSEDPASSLWPYLGLGLGAINLPDVDPATLHRTSRRTSEAHAALGFLQRPTGRLFWGLEGRSIFRFPLKSLHEIQVNVLLGLTWGGRPAAPPAAATPEVQVPVGGARPQASPANVSASAPTLSESAAPAPSASAPSTPASAAPEVGPALVVLPPVPSAATASTSRSGGETSIAAPQAASAATPSGSAAPAPLTSATSPAAASAAPAGAAAASAPPPTASAASHEGATPAGGSVLPNASTPSAETGGRLEALRRGDIPRALELSRTYLKSLPPHHWTLRLEAAWLNVTLKNAARAYPGLPDLFIAPLQLRNGQSVNQLFLGDFASRTEAERALRAVPGYFAKDRLRPFPIQLSDLPTRVCPMTRPVPKPRPASAPAPKGIPVRPTPACTRCHQ